MRSWISIIIASILAGISLSLYQEHFLQSFFLSTLYAGISQVLMLFVMHTMSMSYRSTFHYELWQTKQVFFGQKGRLKQPFPLCVLPIVLALITGGKVPFIATMQHSIESEYAKRFSLSAMRQLDYAFNLAIGPLVLSLVGALVMMSSAGRDLGLVMMATAISHLLPLPNLLGIQVYFFSPPLYIFSFSFSLLIALFSLFMNPLVGVVLSLLLTLVIVVFFYYHRFVK